MAAPPPEPIILSTFASLIETFSSFLIVSIHTILCSRALYPPKTFIATRKYNLAVQQNRHQEVCNWILDACLAIQKQLLKSEAQIVSFVIYQEDAEEVIERWVFDVDRFPLIPEENALTNLDELGGIGVNLVEVEEQLRATLIQLQHRGRELSPLPDDCTYTFVVELKDEAEPPTEQWIQSESDSKTIDNKNSITAVADPGRVRRIPVRHVKTGLFEFRAWIEKKMAEDGVIAPERRVEDDKYE